MLSRIYNEPFIDVPYISPPPVPAPTMGQGFSESDRRRANIYAAQVYEVRVPPCHGRTRVKGRSGSNC